MGKDHADFALLVFEKSYLPNQILHEVFPSIPLLDVQALTMLRGPYGAGPLAETFGTLPKLRGPFMRALMYEPNNPNDVSESLSFPALQSICLTEVSFRVDDDKQPTGIDPDKLIDCLRKRCVRGSRLQKLNLRRCFYVNEIVVERFREVVDVEWDGFEANNMLELMGQEDFRHNLIKGRHAVDKTLLKGLRMSNMEHLKKLHYQTRNN